MISKILSTISLSVLCVVMTVAVASAQTFTGNNVNTAGNSLIPSTGTGGCTIAPQTTGGTTFTNTVSGLTNQPLLNVRLNLNHTWTSDLDIFLVAPNGQILELSTDNGGTGDNYTNTEFCDGVALSIVSGAAPFTGQFRPEGSLTASVCSATITPTVTTLGGFTAGQNGTWNLLIYDDLGGDAGSMVGWSMTFAPPCGFVAASLPTLTFAGSNPAVCGVQNVNVTAPILTCGAAATMEVRLNGVLINAAVPSGGTFQITAPLGNYTLTYRLPCVAPLSQAVVVTDGVPPTVTCPGNVTINLDPGLCDAVYNYSVSASDNCAVTGPLTTLNTITSGGNGNAVGGMVFFDLVNTSSTPLVISAFRVNISAATLIDVYSKAGTSVGFTANAGAWTLAGQANATVGPFSGPFPGNGTLTNAPLTTGNITLAPNSTTGIGLRTNTAASNYTNGNGANQTYTNGPLTLNAGTASNGFFIAGFTPRVFNGSVVFQALVPQPTPVQIAGLPSGAAFPRGVTTNCFRATDAAGNTASCCFTVTVLEFPNPVTQLVCNDLVYFSLDENCSGVVGADDVLEGGPYGCYDDYIVELDKTAPFGNGPWVPAVAGPGDVGKTYQVRVTDPTTNNKCWGNIKFEDKLPPVLVCRDQIIPCNGTPVLEPAPAIVGAQVQIQKPNDPIGEAGAAIPDVQTYNFDYSYIPTGIPVLDVNVRLKLTGHTWLPDLNVGLTAPDGTAATVMTIGGCIGQEWPIDAKFDDAGGAITLCAQLNAAGAPLQCLQGGVSNATTLATFNGKNASGVWKLRIADNVAGDDGVVEIVGLEITVNAPAVAPVDACGPFTLTYIDSEVPGTCATGFSKVVTRKWTAVDASGNSSTCAQKISYQLPTLDDLVPPVDYDGVDAPAFSCTDNAYPTPQWIEGQGLQGFPYVFGEPVGCTINWEYEDLVIEVCDGTYKIRRQWSIIDWCIGDGFEYNQIIKVIDEAGPAFAAPANLTVSTDPFSCCAITNLPDVIIEDNCSRINNISGMVIGFDPFTGEQIG
ncbi:MAG: HYR domain-containing protein, partial [Saprospiraceae bacterium]|nr:HYR domain-containing protein [Saprospiraceae bacterium]